MHWVDVQWANTVLWADYNISIKTKAKQAYIPDHSLITNPGNCLAVLLTIFNFL